MVRIVDSHATAAAAVLDQVERPTVVAAMYPMQPDRLLAALLAEAARRRTVVRLHAADLTGRFDVVRTEWLASGLVELVTIGGRVSPRVSRHADSIPCSLWEIARRFADGTIPVDVFAGMLAPPDRRGHCSFGPVIAYAAAAAEAARYRVVELNPSVLAVPGHPGLPLDRIDVAVDAGPADVPELPCPVVDQTAEAIGGRIAELVPHGATVQLGIGTIPQALCAALAGYRDLDDKDLGLHSGAIPEGAVPLIEAGVFTGRRKPVDTGLHVTTSLLGTGQLYRFAHQPDNRVEMRPVGQTHDPRALAEHHRLVAINSAVEVDLSGQVNAETVNGVRISSPGGQVDFMRAGHLSPGGASILALPSRSRGGTSRIVPRLSTPNTVTTHRNDVDYVVTEFGVADLRGCSGAERRLRLIDVAHPAVRAGLRESDSSPEEE